MANQLLRTEETEAWCDDIPDGSVVDGGDILCQWDYLTRTFDSPSFLEDVAPNQSQQEVDELYMPDQRQRYYQVVNAEQYRQTSPRNTSIHGHVDTKQCCDEDGSANGTAVDSSRVSFNGATCRLPVMCPPLTAYNCYYRNERDTIVQGMTHADDPLPPMDWDFTEPKKAQIVASALVHALGSARRLSRSSPSTSRELQVC
jgi:hypothetical protein